ncbi:MAG TPA: phosphate signaling complex protein PhoU [bacterium]|nr:phosphate signaling complex protein PhoU [bacterium]
MSKHLQRDMENLKQRILEMGSLTERALGAAVEALLERKLDLAESVIQRDEEIDVREVDIEEECLKVLALHQPVAQDLRFLVAVLKVNNDLERIGDHAQNIAKRTVKMTREGWKESPPPGLRKMADRVLQMLKRSLDALVRMDPQAARAVCREDDEVDALLKDLFQIQMGRMAEHPDWIPHLMGDLSVARNLERVADLATNIAEDVVFTVEGEVIRHGGGPEAGSPGNVVPLPRGRTQG